MRLVGPNGLKTHTSKNVLSDLAQKLLALMSSLALLSMFAARS